MPGDTQNSEFCARGCLGAGEDKNQASFAGRHPGWVKVRYRVNERSRLVERSLRERGLHTVCEEAHCPNRGECWSHGATTFLILGDTCTRRCRFCAVRSGKPLPPDEREPERVAEAVATLGLKYAVLTSVTRDDLADEGAGQFAATAEAICRRVPDCKVEALVPDFHAREPLVRRVAEAPLFVFAHNVETVPRLYGRARPASDYRRSLKTLELAKQSRDGLIVKSSLILGLGESRSEVLQTLRDLRAAGCDVVTLGQYLRPTSEALEVFRYLEPAEFAELGAEAERMGFLKVFSGPLVRSSYRAWELCASEVGRMPPALDASSGGSTIPANFSSRGPIV